MPSPPPPAGGVPADAAKSEQGEWDVVPVYYGTDPFTYVPDVVVEATKTTDGVRPVKKGIVKSRLADSGFGHMTLERLDESDPDGDVKGWFETLAEMARR